MKKRNKQAARRALIEKFERIAPLWQQHEHLRRKRAYHAHQRDNEAVSTCDEQSAEYAEYIAAQMDETLKLIAEMLDLPMPQTLPLWVGYEADRPSVFQTREAAECHAAS